MQNIPRSAQSLRVPFGFSLGSLAADVQRIESLTQGVLRDFDALPPGFRRALNMGAHLRIIQQSLHAIGRELEQRSYTRVEDREAGVYSARVKVCDGHPFWECGPECYVSVQKGEL